MSFVPLIRATNNFVIFIYRSSLGSLLILSWLICTWTVRRDAWPGPTLSTAGRQKNVMQSNTLNYLSSKLSLYSVASGLTDLIKMNSNSVSLVAVCTALNGSLNFWTPCPSLATIGITGMSLPLGVIDFWHERTGFNNFPQRITLISRTISMLCSSMVVLALPILFSTKALLPLLGYCRSLSGIWLKASLASMLHLEAFIGACSTIMNLLL